MIAAREVIERLMPLMTVLGGGTEHPSLAAIISM